MRAAPGRAHGEAVLRHVQPRVGTPASFRVIMLDGKAIKYAARRLKALWGVPGSLIAARALVSWD
jgi:hypothetical protein